MKKRLAGTTLLGLAALLLAACNVRVTTDITDSGSGQYGFEIGFTPDDQESLAALDYTPEKLCQEMQSEGGLPEGATIVSEQRGEDVYCVMNQPFDSLDKLNSLYSEGDGITVNTLELSGGKFTYDIDVDLETQDTSATGVIDMEWEVIVPGTVGNHNADTVDGNTLRWKLTPGQSRNIHVESSTGLLSGDTLYYVIGALCSCLCCVALLGVAGGGIYWFTQRNKQTAAA